MQMNPALRDLYQSVILEHSAHPRNYGPLPAATHQAALDNPLCGDSIILYLRIASSPHEPSAPPQIVEAHFEGDGCAIARASASLLTVMVAGKTAPQARAIATELHRFLATRPPTGLPEPNELRSPSALGELVALQGLRSVPSRRRCGTLPWEALVAALPD